MLNRLRPKHIARCLTDLDCQELLARGVCGVLLDLDNTLTGWNSREITPEVERWVQRLQAHGIQACILSNSFTTRRVEPVAARLGIPGITRSGKPLARGFRRGMALMGTTPDTTAIIGDQLFTDILGGNRLGLFTILVDPLSSREAWTTRLLQRPLERLVGRKPVR